jgi:hypothetical protein
MGVAAYHGLVCAIIPISFFIQEILDFIRDIGK